jgi:hypothetical protein
MKKDLPSVSVKIKYHLEKDQFVVLYHTPSSKTICGSSNTLSRSFSKLSGKHGYLTQRTLVQQAETTTLECSLVYEESDGDYILTVKINSEEWVGKGNSMSETFEDVSKSLSSVTFEPNL